MIIVADTSPLNYLVQLNLVELIPRHYGPVVIPDAVERELTDAGAPAVVRGWMVQRPRWLETRPTRVFDVTLPAELGRGEAEAISLALETGARLLIDERWGRHEADLRGLETAGTLAVLLQGALLDGIDLQKYLRRLRELEFRMSDELVQGLLERYQRLRT